MRRRFGTRLLSGLVALGALVVLAVADAGPPAAGTGNPDQLTIVSGTGQPCPDLDVSGRRPSGGCLIPITSKLIATTVRTMVGDMAFAKCSYAHTLRIDSSGRTSIERITSIGPDMCNDVTICKSNRISTPWPGRVEVVDSDSFVNVVEACFDTCMGQFIGRLEMRFARTLGGGWRAVPRNDLVGTSGLELDGGDWEMPDGELELSPDPAT